MRKLFRGLGWLTLLLVVIAVVAKVAFVDVWKIPDDDPRLGISLEPTLSAGDTVLMYRRGEPSFGDLVRCTDPDDANRFVVGRVVGIGGDTVRAHGRELIVDGKRYDGEMACAIEQVTVIHPTSGEKVVLGCDQVPMGGRTHMRGYSGKKEIDTAITKTVAMGNVFLLSDDRSYHDDSRDFGTVPAATCKHRIFFRLWSNSGFSDDKRRFTYVR
jgi:signal peptidase I